MPQTQDWVDGFLFVGKQPALDLLNTELISDGETVELLPDVPALVRWFAAAGLIKAAAAPNARPRRMGRRTVETGSDISDRGAG
jgi:hypothetical protein